MDGMYGNIQQPMNFNDLFMAQNMGMQPQAPSPMIPQQQPMAGPQNVQMPPEMNHINDVINQYTQNKQAQQANSGLVQQILSNRMQPTTQDAAQSVNQTAQSFLTPNLFQPQTPGQAMDQRFATQLAPYTQGIGLQKEVAQTGLANAQAGYYSNALQRDLAEKAFEYANDPAKAQAAMMARYMQGLSGVPQTDQQPSNGVVPPSGDALQEYRQQNGMATPPIDGQRAAMGLPIGTSTIPPVGSNQLQPPSSQGGGFNPMGAMLAKSLGLTDMQIGPNGQPMPIPGSMKVENGSVISFGPDGKPRNEIPVNPRAQGLFEQKLQDIANNVDKLHQIGGMVEEAQPNAGPLDLANQFRKNMGTEMAASPYTGLPLILQGTKAQTLRDNIQADVKQALPLYMQAFGITPGMERAQAAQQMLQDAIGGSLTKSREHTMSNLSNLSQTAGTGQLSQKIGALQQARDAIGSGADKAAVMQRLQGMGIDPSGL